MLVDRLYRTVTSKVSFPPIRSKKTCLLICVFTKLSGVSLSQISGLYCSHSLPGQTFLVESPPSPILKEKIDFDEAVSATCHLCLLVLVATDYHPV